MTVFPQYELSEVQKEQEEEARVLEKMEDLSLLEDINRVRQEIANKKQEGEYLDVLRGFIIKTREELMPGRRPMIFPNEEALKSMTKEDLYVYSSYLQQLKTGSESHIEDDDSEEEMIQEYLIARDKRLLEREEEARNYLNQNATMEANFFELEETEDPEEEINLEEPFGADIIDVEQELDDGRRIFALVVGRYKKVADRVKPVPATYP